MANVYYTVKKGDTLSEIAKKYNTTTTKLAQLNDLGNPNRIYTGQKLLISGSKSSKKNSSSSKTKNSSNKVSINHFGLQSNTDNTMFVTWKWSRSYTDSYRVIWYYATGDGVSFIGNDGTTNDKQSTYSKPSNATKVWVKIKPISTKQKKNNKESYRWTANWAQSKTYLTKNDPPETPSAPSVSLEKFKLTAELDNLDVNATKIEFQVVKDNKTVFKTGKVTISKAHVSYSCTVSAGGEYKVRCRAIRGSLKSDWSQYSSNEATIPATPSKGITSIKAASTTSVYAKWDKVTNATSYELEYATKKSYLGSSDKTNSITGITTNYYTKTGLESGQVYYFRLRVVNDKGNSGWSAVKSVVVGKKPSAPTTWASSTTVKVGDPLNLYWVHNSQDGSSQTYAKLEMTVDGETTTESIKNTTDEDLKDKTSVKSIDTSAYASGAKILWRVRTRGVINEYSDWSVQRTVDIYAPPVLSINLANQNEEIIDTVESFPFYISGYYGPNTQTPTGYHVTIQALSSYETVDNTGLERIVSANEVIYDKYFDTSDNLLVELTPDSIDLEDGIEYKVNVVLSMNSGLTAEDELTFTVSWEDKDYAPTTSISIDPDTLTATITPYCFYYPIINRVVQLVDNVYTMTEEVADIIDEGVGVDDALTDEGEQVFSGTKADGSTVLYCEYEGDETLVDSVTLSVYRREFDGTFTEIGVGLTNDGQSNVIDPHPALDLARYRIVATDKSTGAISFSDPPGEPLPEGVMPSIVIQWAEDWTEFNVTKDEQDELEQPPWEGSLLKLPYNVDVSNSYDPDVSHIEYAGRQHPVSYYGTQKGETATWNTDIPKSDEDTLYALRRLSIYMGDVYVREPSGSGYWASVKVSFSQSHDSMTIPVTLNITRVEGGI